MYVDAFADVPATEFDPTVVEQQTRLEEIADTMRERGRSLGCDGLDALLADEITRLEGSTPLAQSIAGTVRSSLLGTSDDPSDPGPGHVEVDAVDDLRAAVRNAGSGSVITLAAGTYELDETLVVFRPVTLRGPADGRAVIRSTAAEATLLSLADGVLRLSDLAVQHIGTSPASVVVIRAGGHELSGVEVTGGRATDQGVGGFGLAVQPALDGGDRMSEVHDSTLRDNAGGGVLLGAGTRAELRRVTIEGPGGCGVCYVEDAAGTLVDSDISGQDVGVQLEGAAAPALDGVRAHDNTVGLVAVGSGGFRLTGGAIADNDTGLEIRGEGAPTVEGTVLTGNAQTGIALGGDTSAHLTGLEVRGPTEVGLAVSEEATPAIAGTTISTTGEVGVVTTGTSSGTFEGLTVEGQRIGLQVGGASAPVIDGAVLGDHGDVAVLLTGRSTATITAATCRDDDVGVVVLLEQADPDLGDAVDCRIEDQRE